MVHSTYKQEMSGEQDSGCVKSAPDHVNYKSHEMPHPPTDEAAEY